MEWQSWRYFLVVTFIHQYQSPIHRQYIGNNFLTTTFKLLLLAERQAWFGWCRCRRGRWLTTCTPEGINVHEATTTKSTSSMPHFNDCTNASWCLSNHVSSLKGFRQWNANNWVCSMFVLWFCISSLFYTKLPKLISNNVFEFEPLL